MNVDGFISQVNALSFIDGNNETVLVDFLDGLGFGDVDFNAGLKDRSGDHENDEQDENNVDERDHVDLGEGTLRVFGELRHSVRWLPWAGSH